MPRFFRRFAEGRFDLDDVRVRAAELAAFVDEAAVTYARPRDRMVAVGYSNGANIAHATLLLHPDTSFAGAALLHAQLILGSDPLPSLAGRAVFLAAGEADPIVPIEEARLLADTLVAAGATVTPFWSRGGHALTREDVAQAQQWLNSAGFGCRRKQMDPEQLIGQLIGGFLGGKQKRSRGGFGLPGLLGGGRGTDPGRRAADCSTPARSSRSAASSGCARDNATGEWRGRPGHTAARLTAGGPSARRRRYRRFLARRLRQPRPRRRSRDLQHCCRWCSWRSVRHAPMANSLPMKSR